RTRWSARRAFALLPIAHGLDGNADAGGKLCLCELGAGAHAAGIDGSEAPPVCSRRRVSGEGRLSDGPVESIRESALASVGAYFNHWAVGLEPDPQHGDPRPM